MRLAQNLEKKTYLFAVFQRSPLFLNVALS
jgi:hypothetical protein